MKRISFTAYSPTLGTLRVLVPEKAQEGNITLTQANGKSVPVSYMLAKTEFLQYSTGKVSAGGRRPPGAAGGDGQTVLAR